MKTIPNQARALYTRLKSNIGYNHPAVRYSQNAKIVEKAKDYSVSGSLWNGSEDKVTLQVLPGSTFDDDPMTNDSIVFQVKGEDDIYELREFREQHRSGHFGPIRHELKPYSDKPSRGGKS